MTKENRTRKIQLHMFVTQEEKDFIVAKQHAAGIATISDYLRKMAIDGQILKVDNKSTIQAFKDNTHYIGAISRNINQVVKKIHGYGTVDEKDIDEIKELLREVWQLQKSILLNLH